MTLDQISKIQLRRGLESDLPAADLDDGELGFTTDTGRLFIGQLSPSGTGVLLSQADTVELFTSNTPPAAFQPQIRDNQFGFFAAVPLSDDNSVHTLQVYDQTMTPQDFHFDLSGGANPNANAVIHYFVYNFNVNWVAIRQGTINLLWNHLMGSPVCNDTSVVGVGVTGDLLWTAAVVGSSPNQHVVLQYQWNGGPYTEPGYVFFRIDRPNVL